jgi:hypothetical protein
MFLVKGVIETERCQMIDLRKPLPSMEHLIVAQLQDVDLQTTMSHGRVIAHTPNFKRLAIATWDRVQLFSIDHEAFLDSRKGSLSAESVDPASYTQHKKHKFRNFKSEEWVKDDHAYTLRTGQGYYGSYIRLPDGKTRIVALQPIELPRMGVVYRMKFTQDDMLWAWSDRGLVKWYWGPGRRGRRETVELMHMP